MNGRLNESDNRRMNKRMKEIVYGPMIEQVNVRVSKRVYGQMNDLMEEGMDV